MNRAFRFRLARARRAREIAERAARGEWAAAVQAARGAESRAEELRRRADLARAESVSMRSSGALAPGDVLAADRAVQGIWEALRRGRERAAKLAATAERRHETWAAAERERQVLARLEERRRTEHRAEVQRAEEQELDEWTLGRRR